MYMLVFFFLFLLFLCKWRRVTGGTQTQPTWIRTQEIGRRQGRRDDWSARDLGAEELEASFEVPFRWVLFLRLRAMVSTLNDAHTIVVHRPTAPTSLAANVQSYSPEMSNVLLDHEGPYARRLALTLASLLNLEYEYIALHRDVGETELKQVRWFQPTLERPKSQRCTESLEKVARYVKI
ncbi:hypothetical protein K435DRAFT_788208 [Dendrothele bispora CBS 962.96]|uniref:GST N-terminal domain-containing protein n=1 Tax=Dendrothele bispora (strain CBS 962.96) TaxID=1314807 RepID=A0A4S8MYQ5_DENBC|nr:hypothetical protein K435DRAFT_788208 [Dendrothele bispora CBS 962.96]